MESTAFATSATVAPWRAVRNIAVTRRPRATFQACAAQPALSVSDVIAVAERQGLELRNECKGPIIKLDLFKDGRLTAFITGVVLPQQRLHIESYKAKSKTDGSLLSVSPGMLVFIGALAFGSTKGCKEVYGLAIKDEKRQHERLRRYLRRFGGEEVKQVGNSMHDIPNKLLYGGEGMIVKGNVASMLQRSKRMLERVAPTSAVH